MNPTEQLQWDLIDAIIEGDLKKVKNCCDRGADVNCAANMTGDIPVYLCLKKYSSTKKEGYKEIFKYLVKERKADVNVRIGSSKNKLENLPLLHHFLLTFGIDDIDMLKVILSNGGYSDINVPVIVEGKIKAPISKRLSEVLAPSHPFLSKVFEKDYQKWVKKMKEYLEKKNLSEDTSGLEEKNINSKSR